MAGRPLPGVTQAACCPSPHRAATRARSCSPSSPPARPRPAGLRAAADRRPAGATTTCTSPSTSATSCTTAACPASTTRWEWDPSLLALRAVLEAPLRGRPARRRARGRRARRRRPTWTSRCARSPTPTTAPRCRAISSCAAPVRSCAEFVVHRSAYQLKEADPHSWAIPRLWGPPKAALVEVQADEYGGGRAERIHATLFADAMEALGLDARYGAYVDRVPGVDAGDGQPHVAAGAAPPPARGDRRAPRALRDDVVAAQPPLRERGCAASGSTTRARRTSSTSTSWPTPCTRTSRPSTWPAGWPARSRELGRRHPVGRARARRRRGALGAPPARRLGRRASSLRVRCRSRRRLEPDRRRRDERRLVGEAALAASPPRARPAARRGAA